MGYEDDPLCLFELAPPPRRNGWRWDPVAAQGAEPAGMSHDRGRFSVPPRELWAKWLDLMGTWPRTETVRLDEEQLLSFHIQRSRFFRFPDLIRAAVVPLGAGASGLAIDSRARYGYYDFGVNRRRVAALINALTSNDAR